MDDNTQDFSLNVCAASQHLYFFGNLDPSHMSDESSEFSTRIGVTHPEDADVAHMFDWILRGRDHDNHGTLRDYTRLCVSMNGHLPSLGTMRRVARRSLALKVWMRHFMREVRKVQTR
jgi:hypothetical protein